MSWQNALRNTPIPQEIMDTHYHRCECPENPDVDYMTGDGSNLPCMEESYPEDNTLKCSECIYCKILEQKPKINLYAYKFNEKSDRCLNELTQSRVYKLWKQAEEDVSKISEQDIDWLTEQINQNTYFKNGSVPLQGWAFDFAPICKTFWVKTDEYPNIFEVIAPSEEACRRYVNNNILDEDHFILEIR